VFNEKKKKENILILICLPKTDRARVKDKCMYKPYNHTSYEGIYFIYLNMSGKWHKRHT